MSEICKEIPNQETVIINRQVKNKNKKITYKNTTFLFWFFRKVLLIIINFDQYFNDKKKSDLFRSTNKRGRELDLPSL